MNRITKACATSVGGALLGAVAMATLGGTAEAAGKRATPQLFQFKAGKTVVKDNIAGKSGVALGQFTRSTYTQFTVAAGAVKIVGAGSSTRQMLLIVLGAPDVRTAELPLTIAIPDKNLPGDNPTVTVGYSDTQSKYVGRFPNGSLRTTLKGWGSDENTAGSFSVTFKSYSAATNRVAGTFSGTLQPGDDFPGLNPVKISGGKFNVDCAFTGL